MKATGIVVVVLLGSVDVLRAQSVVAMGRFEVIASTHIPLAGDANRIILGLGQPAISNSGQVVFTTLNLRNGVGLERSLVLWKEGLLDVEFASGQSAPGWPGATFDSFTTPRINDAGDIIFSAKVGGSGITSSRDTGVWKFGSAGPQLIAREGDVVGSNTIDDLLAINPVIANNGTSYFVSGRSSALWRSSPTGELSLLAKQGTTGSASTEPFGQISLPAVNASGAAVFSTSAGASSDSPDFLNNSWGVSPDGNVRLLLKVGDAVSNSIASGVVQFRSADASVNLGPSGKVSLAAWLLTNDGKQIKAVLSGDVDHPLEPVFIPQFTPVPDETLQHFDGIGDILINDIGQFVLADFLQGPSVDYARDTGVWISTPSGDLQKLFQEGDEAPGLAGVRFGHFPPLGAAMDFNNAGQLLVQIPLIGSGVNPMNSESLWLGSIGDGLHLIARTGDVLEVAPGLYKTIGSINFDRPMSFDLNRHSLNDRGKVVFTTQFTDGTIAIVAVPETSSRFGVGFGLWLAWMVWSVRVRRMRSLSRSAHSKNYQQQLCN